MRLLILVIHICGGVVGLVSGIAAVSFRKGSARHRIAGNIFFISMLTNGSTAALLGNVFGGAITFYLVTTGWLVYSNYGPPDVLKLEENYKPVRGEDEVLIEGLNLKGADFVSPSRQLLVFQLSFNQNRNIRVGVFPERVKVLISLASSCCIALKDGSACETDVCKGIQNAANRPAAMTKNLLKLSRSFRAFVQF